jgi:hypothetical protein
MNDDPFDNKPGLPTPGVPVPPIGPQRRGGLGLVLGVVGFLAVAAFIVFGVIGIDKISDIVRDAGNSDELRDRVAADLLAPYTPSGAAGEVFVASDQTRIYAPAGWAFDLDRQWTDGVGCSGEGSSSGQFCDVAEIYKTGAGNDYKYMTIQRLPRDFYDTEVELEARIQTDVMGNLTVQGAARAAVFAGDSGQTTVHITIIIESPSGEVFELEGFADTGGRLRTDLNLQDVVDLVSFLRVESTDAALVVQ